MNWHSYSDHLREALREMMTTGEFADVTLVTDDKQQIRAHRNILSAASPVLKNILKLDSDNKNSVIYLRGIQHSEMESIMQFIYLGEARFYEERMSEFLMVSKNLEIKELSNGMIMNNQTESNEIKDEHEEVFSNEDIENDIQTIPSKSISSKIRQGTTGVVSEDAKFKGQDCEKVFNSNKSKHKGLKYACNQCDYHATTQSNLAQHIQSKHEGVKYECSQCAHQFLTHSGLTRHIQSVHESVKYGCNECDQQFTQQGSLKTHMMNKHEGVKFACNKCDQQFPKQDSLKHHIQSFHEGLKYACNQCDYQAARQNNLATHIQIRHEGLKYTCSQCNYESGYKNDLTKHIKSMHEGLK